MTLRIRPMTWAAIATAGLASGCCVVLYLDNSLLALPVIGTLWLMTVSSLIIWLIYRERQIRIFFAGMLVITVGGCVIGVGVEGAQSVRAQRRGETIAGALERFREREGRYPASLAQLVPSEINTIPAPGVGFTRERGEFFYWSDVNGFGLAYPAYGLMTCSRLGRNRWLCAD